MCLQEPSRYQGIPFVVRGDLCDLVRMGAEYSVIGVPTHTLSSGDAHIAVETVIEVKGHAVCIQCNRLITQFVLCAGEQHHTLHSRPSCWLVPGPG